MFDLSSFYLPTANAEPQGDYYCYFCRYSLVSYNRVYPFSTRLLLNGYTCLLDVFWG